MIAASLRPFASFMQRMHEEAQNKLTGGSERGGSSGVAYSRSGLASLATTGIRRVWDKADDAPVSETRFTPRPNLTVMRHLSVAERNMGSAGALVPRVRKAAAERGALARRSRGVLAIARVHVRIGELERMVH